MKSITYGIANLAEMPEITGFSAGVSLEVSLTIEGPDMDKLGNKEDIYRLLCILEHRWARAAALVHGASLAALEEGDDLSPTVLELLNLAAEDLEDRSGLQRIRAAVAGAA